MPALEPMPGAPPYVVWTVGLLFIVLILTLVGSIIWIAVSIYQDAHWRGAPAILWLLAALIGGWLTAIAWMVIRDRYEESVPVTAASAEAPQPNRPGAF